MSHRCFPTKAVRAFHVLPRDGALELVARYHELAGGFDAPALPRPLARGRRPALDRRGAPARLSERALRAQSPAAARHRRSILGPSRTISLNSRRAATDAPRARADASGRPRRSERWPFTGFDRTRRDPPPRSAATASRARDSTCGTRTRAKCRGWRATSRAVAVASAPAPLLPIAPPDPASRAEA